MLSRLQSIIKPILIMVSSLALLFFIDSCQQPEACIDGPNSMIVGQPSTFSSCGTGNTLTWTVFDGTSFSTYSGASITLSPSQVSNQTTLTLIAETSAGQDITQKIVDVTYGGHRILIRDQQFEDGNTTIEGIAGASVKLYENAKSWKNENNSYILLSGESDANGFFIIPEELGLGPFCIDASGYTVHANWNVDSTEMIIEFEQGQIYDEIAGVITLDHNALFTLSGRDHWKRTDVTFNGQNQLVNVPVCELEDSIKFDRKMRWVATRNTNFCTYQVRGSGPYELPEIQFSTFPLVNKWEFNLQDTVGQMTADSIWLESENELYMKRTYPPFVDLWTFKYVQ